MATATLGLARAGAHAREYMRFAAAGAKKPGPASAVKGGIVSL